MSTPNFSSVEPTSGSATPTSYFCVALKGDWTGIVKPNPPREALHFLNPQRLHIDILPHDGTLLGHDYIVDNKDDFFDSVFTGDQGGLSFIQGPRGTYGIDPSYSRVFLVPQSLLPEIEKLVESIEDADEFLMARESDVMYIEWNIVPEPGDVAPGWVPEIEMLEEEFIRKSKPEKRSVEKFSFVN
jgi:hypothetical protein